MRILKGVGVIVVCCMAWGLDGAAEEAKAPSRPPAQPSEQISAKLEFFKKQLALTDEQTAKVRGVLERAQAKVAEIPRPIDHTSGQDYIMQRKAISLEIEDQIMDLLDPERKKKYEEFLKVQERNRMRALQAMQEGQSGNPGPGPGGMEPEV